MSRGLTNMQKEGKEEKIIGLPGEKKKSPRLEMKAPST